MKARAKIIAAEIRDFVIEMGEAMCRVHDDFDAARMRHVANLAYRQHLAREVNHVGDEDRFRSRTDGLFVELHHFPIGLRDERDVDDSVDGAVSVGALGERIFHARIFALAPYNLVAALEIETENHCVERFRRVAADHELVRGQPGEPAHGTFDLDFVLVILPPQIKRSDRVEARHVSKLRVLHFSRDSAEPSALEMDELGRDVIGAANGEPEVLVLRDFFCGSALAGEGRGLDHRESPQRFEEFTSWLRHRPRISQISSKIVSEMTQQGRLEAIWVKRFKRGPANAKSPFFPKKRGKSSWSRRTAMPTRRRAAPISW